MPATSRHAAPWWARRADANSHDRSGRAHAADRRGSQAPAASCLDGTSRGCGVTLARVARQAPHPTHDVERPEQPCRERNHEHRYQNGNRGGVNATDHLVEENSTNGVGKPRDPELPQHDCAADGQPDQEHDHPERNAARRHDEGTYGRTGDEQAADDQCQREPWQPERDGASHAVGDLDGCKAVRRDDHDRAVDLRNLGREPQPPVNKSGLDPLHDGAQLDAQLASLAQRQDTIRIVLERGDHHRVADPKSLLPDRGERVGLHDPAHTARNELAHGLLEDTRKRIRRERADRSRAGDDRTHDRRGDLREVDLLLDGLGNALREERLHVVVGTQRRKCCNEGVGVRELAHCPGAHERDRSKESTNHDHRDTGNAPPSGGNS